MKSLILVTLTISLVGCLQTREQLRNNIGGGKGESAATQSHVVKAQQESAQEVPEIGEIEEQMRLMVGRIENLENEQRLENQRKLQKAKEQVDSQSSVDERMKLMQEALTRLEQKIEAMDKELKQAKLQAAAKPQKPKKKAGNFTGAEMAFTKKKWKEAIAGYQKYRELNPGGRRYVNATYKIGVSFEELGMKSEASAFYKEVIQKFPKSTYVKKAQYRLSRL